MSNVSFGSIVKKSGAYAIAVLATRALSFILIPFYTHYLTTTDYGILELLDLTLNFTIVFAGSRLGQALFYFYFAEQDEETRDHHISTSVIGSVLLGCMAFLVCWFLALFLSRLVFGSPEYARYFKLTAVAVGLAIPMETGLCCLRAFNEPGRYSIIAMARVGVAGLLNIFFLGWLHMGVSSMLWSSIISQSLVVLFLSGYVFSRIPLIFDMKLFRQQVGYTAPLTVSSIGEFILNYGDRYFLRSAVTLSEIGIYSLAYKIGMLIPMVQYPFQLYWGSQQVKIVRGPGGMRVFTRTATYLALLLTFSLVGIMLFIEPLLHIMVSPGFRAAAQYAPLVACAYLLRAVGGFFREIFIIEKRPALEARATWVGTATCLTGYALLIPRFGLWGAVMATLSGFLILFCYSLYSSLRVRHVDYEYVRLAKMVIAAVIVAAIYYTLKSDIFWIQVLIGTVLTLAYVALLYLMKFWADDEREYVMEQWQTRFPRNKRESTSVT